MAPSVTQVSGTVTGDVEVRFTESGLTVARFRLTETPTRWDAATRQWCDGTPIRYVCTIWRDLARTASESLADGTAVLVKGRITEVKDGCIYLSVDDIGISLRQRIVYTEASLPSPIAAAPVTPPPAPPATAPSASQPRRPGSPPRWWEQSRSGGWNRTDTPSTADNGAPLRAVR
ncbi:single-stranded DNA-binding protein [Streptomyces sp. V3I7]|uniref:single-stranded DNA-binding protein n=1 Tax=Streptomyces sp. V3I7 TaxID=3042278 RepID=UPI0027813080|nr:single-stranded DNA-binding protein [Streptomyces sp. V3I7]MDQ0994804.1 single-strand DNA-binding protein [Streptomyces sp. V3I7]